MSQGRPIGAKLYLEGIEVPFNGITLTSSVGTASIAYIEVVPHYHINHIKPRTHVAVAVRDFHNPDDDFPFVLAWEGEVFGYNFSKTPQSRSMTLSCIDYTSYWDNVLNYFFNPMLSLGKGTDFVMELGLDSNTAKASGIDLVSVTHAISTHYKAIIQEKLKESGTDFIDGLVAILQKMGSVNSFYQSNQDRLRINDRIALRSSGQLTELLEKNEAISWFEGVVNEMSGYATLRDVVNSLLSILFHDYVTIPFPARVSAKQNLASYLELNGKSDSAKKTIGNFIFKPNLYMLPPPMCNVFYPDEYSNFVYQRNFLREPTRLIYKPTLPRPLQNGGVGMPHVYAPESFRRFMYGKSKGIADIGSVDWKTLENPGNYFSELRDNVFATKKHEQHFLTNEERMRGILLRENGLVPASSAFRQFLDEAHAGDFSKKVADYLFFKARYETRELQITSHLKLSVVPGFTVLLLDPGDSDQNIIAYCSQVTHRITPTEGGYTQTTLSYARTVTEQQTSQEGQFDPLIPPWFDKSIFGDVGGGQVSSEAAKNLKNDVSGSLYTRAGYGKLTEFYKTLLGDKGSTAMVDAYKDEGTLVGATYRLIGEYNAYKEKPGADIQSFISKKTDRDYVRIRDAFGFLHGATTQTKDLRATSFSEFSGGAFGWGDSFGDVVKTRRDVIIKYRNALKDQRGFRG